MTMEGGSAGVVGIVMMVSEKGVEGESETEMKLLLEGRKGKVGKRSK